MSSIAMNSSTPLLVGSSEAIPAWITILFSLLLVGLIVCLAMEEKLHAKKSIIAGSFAIICLFLGTATGILGFRDVVVESYPVVLPDEPVPVQIIVDPENEKTENVIVGAPAASPNEEKSQNEKSEPNLSTDDRESEDEGQLEESELHFGGHNIEMPVYIPGIDWSVIAIILGSSIFVDVSSRSGLFSWIAIRVTKLSAGEPVRLLWFYGLMTVVFSAVLNNVTAMIIVGSLTAVSLDKLGQSGKLPGFLLVEGLLTNIGGLLTLISSVPNIIVGTTANISFVKFLMVSAPYVVLATILTLWMGAKFFKIEPLKSARDKVRARRLVEGFDENDGINSWNFFRFAAIALIVFIVLIAGASSLPVINHLGMGFVALSMAAVMLLVFRNEVDRFYKAVDWDLLGFFMALFVVIYVMEHAGVLTAIGDGLQFFLTDIESEKAGIFDSSLLLVGAAGFSSVTDNIPLAAMLASILSDLGAPQSSALWWSVIFGANLGGNLTPIGSASTLVAVTIMHKHQIGMPFFRFVKTAFPFAVSQIVLAIAYVLCFIGLQNLIG